MLYSPEHPSRKYPTGPGRYFGAATLPIDIRASYDELRRASRSPIAWILSNLISRVTNDCHSQQSISMKNREKQPPSPPPRESQESRSAPTTVNWQRNDITSNLAHASHKGCTINNLFKSAFTQL